MKFVTVIICIFFPFLASLMSVALWISIIFLSGSARKAFFNFRIFTIEVVTYANDLVRRGFVISLLAHLP